MHPPCSTADDAGTQHISCGTGVDTTPIWPINLTIPSKFSRLHCRYYGGVSQMHNGHAQIIRTCFSQ
jgi:hypothetical protein